VRLILRLAHTEPLAPLLSFEPLADQNGEDVFWPGDADPEKITDDELRAWIRQHAGPIFHPVSSARMGRSAENSVVDVALRVHGVEGLRIVDASVFPGQLSGHPCAVVAAVAERAADLIRADG